MCKNYFFLVIFLLSCSLLSADVKQDKVNREVTKPTAASEVKKSADLHLPSKNINSVTAVTSFDFTASSSRYYGGTAAAVEVETGVWAMIAGDANADGYITTSDYNLWLPENNSAASGYLATDMNLDGNVTTSDYNLWLPNNNAARFSQVP